MRSWQQIPQTQSTSPYIHWVKHRLNFNPEDEHWSIGIDYAPYDSIKVEVDEYQSNRAYLTMLRDAGYVEYWEDVRDPPSEWGDKGRLTGELWRLTEEGAKWYLSQL